jgi:hypothetical protein
MLEIRSKGIFHLKSKVLSESCSFFLKRNLNFRLEKNLDLKRKIMSSNKNFFLNETK